MANTTKINGNPIAATTVVGSYFAQGKLSANQLITTGSDVVIQFVDDYDPQSWWNISTYRFTPTVAGYYNVSLGVWFENMAASSSAQVNAQARKNGNSFIFSLRKKSYFEIFKSMDKKYEVYHQSETLC